MAIEMPFRRPLLATEHTDFDTGAERVAFALAQHCGVPLAAVLPLVTNPEYEVTAPELVAQAEAKAHARLLELRAAAAAAGVELDASVRRGDDAARAIVDEATRRGTDLIVARRRGRQSFLAKLMVGEMVAQVAIDSPCDVLLVPRTAQMWSQRVLAAVDDSPGSERVAETAARIAARCGLPLTIATAAPRDDGAARAQADAAVAGAETAAARCGLTAERQVLVGPPAEAIVGLAGTQGADLVVVGRSDPRRSTHRRRLGATAHRVIGLAACPVLIVRT